MARSREAITQQVIDELKQQIEAAKGDPQALEKLLEHELQLQEEAEWDLPDQSITKAVDRLKLSANKSLAEYLFVKKWDGAFESFSPLWYKFVSNFLANKSVCNGGIVLDLEYELGISEPPEKNNDNNRDESSMQREARLEEEACTRKVQTKAAMEQFLAERAFWNAKNLCRMFIAYLATWPGDVTNEIVHIRHNIIQNLVNNVLPSENNLPGMFEDYVEALGLVKGHHCSKDNLRESEYIYREVSEIYDDFATMRGQQDELVRADEWQRVNQLVMEQSANDKLYKDYIEIIQALYLNLNQLKTKPEEHMQPAPVLLKPNASRYATGGAGVGMLGGGAIILAMIFGGALAVFAAPVAIAIALSIFVALAIAGGVVGFAIGQHSTMPSPEAVTAAPVDVSASAASTSTFRQTCSTLACALLLGPFSFCMAAPDMQDQQNDNSAPLSQVDDDYDADAPSASSANKAGLSNRR